MLLRDRVEIFIAFDGDRLSRNNVFSRWQIGLGRMRRGASGEHRSKSNQPYRHSGKFAQQIYPESIPLALQELAELRKISPPREGEGVL